MCYVQEKIIFADDMLVRNAVAKIDDGDIILTYGYSSIVFSIFVQAQKVHSPPVACLTPNELRPAQALLSNKPLRWQMAAHLCHCA